MANSHQDQSFQDRIKRTESKSLIRLMKLFNIINAGALIAIGVLGLITLGSFSIGILFLAIYIGVFGCVLIAFECRFGALEVKLRRVFGFMFSYLGRALFLVFLGTLAFAMDSVGGYIVGALTLVNAIFNLVVIYSHPAFSSHPPTGGDIEQGKAPNGAPPSAPNQGGNPYNQEMTSNRNNPYANDTQSAVVSAGAQYVADNPEVAVRATQAAAQYVANNPQVISQVAKQTPNPYA